MYNKLLSDYELQYTNFLDKKIKKHCKHNLIDLFLDGYNCDSWFDKPNDKALIGLLWKNQ